MPAVRRTPFMELVWRFHRWAYQATGGRLGGRMMGMPVLLLTTTGRKSGAPRTNALMYLPEGRGCVVIASNAGEPRHPGWWLNLQARPRATIQRGREVTPVVAREAEGEERARLWAKLVAIQPSYEVYRQRTARRIPVVVLEAAAQAKP
jgi:deazaflavin-dependent oxidoreductase (nitroreductase family)